MVELRLDWRLKGRLDASDVLQEAYMDLESRLDEYLRDPKGASISLARLVVGERLINLHRHHLGAQMRDPAREVSLYRGAMPEASSAALAAKLLGKHTSPSQAAIRAERMLKLQEALNSLDSTDREVIALRHFEQLSRSEAAQVPGHLGGRPLPNVRPGTPQAEDSPGRFPRRLGGDLSHEPDLEFQLRSVRVDRPACR